MTSGWQIGVDIGGTFTDIVAFHPATNDVASAKVPSQPNNPIAGLLSALQALGRRWEDADDLVHGTTMVTNAIVEGNLARVALVATEGFADTLSIGRQNRRYLYRLDLPPKSTPQVSEDLRFEVPERLDVQGEVVEELTDEAIEALADAVAESGAEVVAVSLLHAYANPVHELKLGEKLKSIVPYVALSHLVNPESREYERTGTTALSAGVMPIANTYLEKLEAECPDSSRLHMFHSAGGMAAPETLTDTPLGLAFSGPAAGVSAAASVAAQLGLAQAISFDMGGTTTDVCLIVDGKAEINSNRSLSDHPLRQPMVAVESIGAGGGSIAAMDVGVLRVGPESAGAEPGPACYGKGGTAPTVSDANLVLGYLDAGREVGGGIRLDRDASVAALTPLAAEIGVTVPALALGILKVVHASMVRALRRVTVEQGVDGRQATLLAFGGAGPLHAVELARSFGMGRVVVPHASSVLSAVGCVTAEMSYTQQRTMNLVSTGWASERLAEIRRQMKAQLMKPFEDAGKTGTVSEVAAIRYSGQSYAVEIHQPVLDDPDTLGQQFRDQHHKLYGFATDDPWELVSLRITVSAPRTNHLPEIAVEGGSDKPARTVADCWFDDDEPVATPRYDRNILGRGDKFVGPVIIEDEWSTIVLPPGAELEVDRYGHLHIDCGGVA
jgi:N-methylhydantoinase A